MAYIQVAMVMGEPCLPANFPNATPNLSMSFLIGNIFMRWWITLFYFDPAPFKRPWTKNSWTVVATSESLIDDSWLLMKEMVLDAILFFSSKPEEGDTSKLGIKPSFVRLFFIYLSFVNFGIPLVYLSMVFILRVRNHFKYRKRPSVFDL